MYLIIKRISDIFLALFSIILFSPILFIVIIILKFSGDGEIFYLQERVGYRNNIFFIYKFATMIKNSPNLGNGDITLRNDPRVTKVGKYLRKTKINELPQIFNILKGDISVVGPRPLMKAGFSRYSKSFQNTVYNVKPGLTGIGSIIFRDEEKILTESKLKPSDCYRNVILPHKGQLELWYQRNRSLKLDLQLIIITAWVIAFPESTIYNRWFKDLPSWNF